MKPGHIRNVRKVGVTLERRQWRGRRLYLPITSTILLSLLLTLFGRLV